MNYTMTGRLHQIGETIDRSGKFRTRDAIVRVEDGTREQFPTVQFIQNDCAHLDRFGEGDPVTIEFKVEGRYVPKADRHFTNLRVVSIRPADNTGRRPF